MFCGRCGQQIPDASELCPLCGQPASINLPPPNPDQHEAIAPVTAPVSALVEQRPIDPKLKGVGGWLLFFCVVITILTPLGAVRELALDDLFSTENLVVVVVAVFGLVVGLIVWSAQRLAIPLLRAYFIFMAIIAVLGVVGAVVEMQGVKAEPGSTVDGNSMVAFVASFRSLIFVLIWGTYFHKSERVRATFGRNLWGRTVPRLDP
ncbi:MAG: hypothetical protein LAO20_12135 [Acidobacteriia bacterium]|nr:hypothetical protein [Terriglobia bacterium]